MNLRNRRTAILALAALILALAGCSLFAPDETALMAPAPDWGSADFTTYVALGNSLTGGYQSGALYADAQEQSFTSLLATAMGTPFEQPLIAAPGYYDAEHDSGLPVGHLQVTFDDVGDAVLGPTPWSGGPPALLNAGLTLPYNNLGVPGALTVDLLQATDAASSAGGANTYFDMILRNADIDWSVLGAPAADLTPVEQALLLQPTFMTVWIGNNEILGAATAGVGTPLVDAATFGFLYDQLLDALVANVPGKAIVVANIPPVTAVPYFTTVPWFVLDPDQNPVDGDPGSSGIQFVGLLAEDKAPSYQLESGDLVTIKLLSYDSEPDGTPDLEQGMGIPDPVLIAALMAQGMSQSEAEAALPVAFPHHGELIPGSLTLVADEAASILDATLAFNDIISARAAEDTLAVVDTYAVLADVAANGWTFGEEVYTSEFVTGGLFSLDGVHPSAIGYVRVAQAFMDVINTRWGAALTLPSVPLLPRTTLPPVAKLQIDLPADAQP